jgi:hypothetical protein
MWWVQGCIQLHTSLFHPVVPNNHRSTLNSRLHYPRVKVRELTDSTSVNACTYICMCVVSTRHPAIVPILPPEPLDHASELHNSYVCSKCATKWPSLNPVKTCQLSRPGIHFQLFLLRFRFPKTSNKSSQFIKRTLIGVGATVIRSSIF